MPQKKPARPIKPSNPFEVAAMLSEMHGYTRINSISIPDLGHFLAELPRARKAWLKGNELSKDPTDLAWERKDGHWRHTQYSPIGKTCFISKLTSSSLCVTLHSGGGQPYGTVTFANPKTPEEPMFISWDIDPRKTKNWGQKKPAQTGVGHLSILDRGLGATFVIEMPPVVRVAYCEARIYCCDIILDCWGEHHISKLMPDHQASARSLARDAARERAYYTKLLVGDFSSILWTKSPAPTNPSVYSVGLFFYLKKNDFLH